MVNLRDVFPFLSLHPSFEDGGERPGLGKKNALHVVLFKPISAKQFQLAVVLKEMKRGRRRTWVKRALIYFAVNRDGTINLPALYFLALATIITATGLMVYNVLVLTAGFSLLGSHYRTICIIKDFFTVLLLRSLSSYYMIRGEHHHHLADTDQFQPGVFTFFRSLFYRFILRSAEPPTVRWYSTFIGDHLLLFVVGLAYIWGTLLMPFLYWPQWPTAFDVSSWSWCALNRAALLFQALQGTYLAMLLMGLLYCSLEHTAKFRQGHERAAQWHLLCFQVLWVPQFMIWYRVHEDLHTFHMEELEVLYEWVGAGPQIFISHSSAMLGAILLGHHNHFHPSHDLSVKSCVAVALAVAAYGLFWMLFKEAAKDLQERRNIFIKAEMLPYTSVAGQAVMSLVCLIWINGHSKSTSARSSAVVWGLGARSFALQGTSFEPPESVAVPEQSDGGHGSLQAPLSRLDSATRLDSGNLARTRTGNLLRQSSLVMAMRSSLEDEEEQAWEYLRMRTMGSFGSVASDGHGEEGHGHGTDAPVFMDYDCVLVMITLVVSSLHPLSRIYGHYSNGEGASWAAQVVAGIIYPFSVSFFVLVAWIQHPRKSCMLKFGLWLGLVSCLNSMSARSNSESCIVNSSWTGMLRECCYYPGWYDFNSRVIDLRGEHVTVETACQEGHGGSPHGHHMLSSRRLEETTFLENGSAFMFFQVLGSVGQVEFFFTLTGLFLKLILRLPSSRGHSHSEDSVSAARHGGVELAPVAEEESRSSVSDDRPSTTVTSFASITDRSRIERSSFASLDTAPASFRHPEDTSFQQPEDVSASS